MSTVLASNCGTEDACPGTKSVAGLAILGIVAVVLIVLGWRALRRARRADGPARSVLAGAWIGTAVFFLACLISSLRSFGGQSPGDPDSPSEYRCAPMFIQFGSPGGVAHDGSQKSSCLTVAEDAIPAVLAESAGGGLLCAAVAFGASELRRRQFDRRLQQLATSD